MNNDLKSSEALKAYARKVFCEDNITNNSLLKMFDYIIDNAPTVFSCNACKNMGNEQECVDCHDYSNYVYYDERPQGEWKVYGRQGGIPITDKCSNCKYEMMWYRNKYNFCPNCGAKMLNGCISVFSQVQEF